MVDHDIVIAMMSLYKAHGEVNSKTCWCVFGFKKMLVPSSWISTIKTLRNELRIDRSSTSLVGGPTDLPGVIDVHPTPVIRAFAHSSLSSWLTPCSYTAQHGLLDGMLKSGADQFAKNVPCKFFEGFEPKATCKIQKPMLGGFMCLFAIGSTVPRQKMLFVAVDERLIKLSPYFTIHLAMVELFGNHCLLD